MHLNTCWLLMHLQNCKCREFGASDVCIEQGAETTQIISVFNCSFTNKSM